MEMAIRNAAALAAFREYLKQFTGQGFEPWLGHVGSVRGGQHVYIYALRKGDDYHAGFFIEPREGMCLDQFLDGRPEAEIKSYVGTLMSQVEGQREYGNDFFGAFDAEKTFFELLEINEGIEEK